MKEKYIIDEEFLSTPEAKSLNEMRKLLMNSFGVLKNGSSKKRWKRRARKA